MADGIIIRRATPDDVDTLIAFGMREAWEAEGVEGDPEAVSRGVRAAFADPPLATYWLVESADGHLVASTSVVTEWSNFHGGFYWWVQSLFVVPERRGAGLVDAVLEHLATEARGASALDLRLYARTSNHRALRAYRRCGFAPAPYAVMTRRLDRQAGK